MARTLPNSRLTPVILILLTLLGPSAAAAAQQPAPTTTPTPTLTPAAGPLPPSESVIALALSGSGFLGLFFTGVVAQLQDLGLANRATPVAGTSGGSLVGMTSCLGLSGDQAAYVAQSIAAHCRAARRSCAGSLDGALRAAVALAVDVAAGAGATQEQKDTLVRDRCAGVATATISRLVPAAAPVESAGDAAAAAPPAPTFSGTVAWHVSDFRDAADFAAAGAASSFIPWFSGGAAHTTFRGAPAMDGGFEEMLPPCSPPRDGDAAAGGLPCVRVSAVPPGSLLMPGLPAPPSDAEIAPGKYGPLPGGMTAAQWASYALVAPDEGMGALMMQHGRQQALAWAREAFPERVAQAAEGAALGGGAAGATEQQQEEPKQQEQQQQEQQPQVQQEQQPHEQQEQQPLKEAAGKGEAPPAATGARRKARKLLLSSLN